MDKKTWKFPEEQRPAVCQGQLCPACLGTNIKCVGAAPDMINMNMAFDCQDCGEQWEGY